MGRGLVRVSLGAVMAVVMWGGTEAGGDRIAWWKLEESFGSIAAEYESYAGERDGVFVLNGNDGQEGRPMGLVWQPLAGVHGGCLFFDGASYPSSEPGGYLSCGTDPAFNFGNRQPFTVVAWFRLAGPGQWDDDGYTPIVAKWSDWRMSQYSSSDNLRFYLRGTRRGSADVSDGLWHHCAIVYDGTRGRMYVDG